MGMAVVRNVQSSRWSLVSGNNPLFLAAVGRRSALVDTDAGALAPMMHLFPILISSLIVAFAPIVE